MPQGQSREQTRAQKGTAWVVAPGMELACTLQVLGDVLCWYHTGSTSTHTASKDLSGQFRKGMPGCCWGGRVALAAFVMQIPTCSAERTSGVCSLWVLSGCTFDGWMFGGLSSPKQSVVST